MYMPGRDGRPVMRWPEMVCHASTVGMAVVIELTAVDVAGYTFTLSTNARLADVSIVS